MTTYFIQDTSLVSIGDAIRGKLGTTDVYSPAEMVTAIESIPTGGQIQASKDATPTESAQTIRPDAGYDGLGKVEVGAISSTYIGSEIPRRTDSGNITLDGSTTSKSYAAGYYANAHGAQHTTVDIPNPTISVNSTGLITASGSWTAGFTTDTSYNNTSQLSTKAGTSIKPTSSSQIAIYKNTYAIGDIRVAAVPTETKTVTENGTVTPTSGNFFSSVTVAIPLQHYYEGTETPSSSLGEDGDIYLKTS